MAKIPMYDPLSKEARSSWLAGLTEAANKLSGLLEMKTETLNNLPLPELFISEDDRYRIFQAPLGNKLWLTSPAPVIKKNGIVITPDNEYFTVDCLGGSVAFDENHRLTAGDSLTVDAVHIVEGSGKLEDLTNDIDATAAIAEHYRGYFATYAELAAITGVNGDFAIVGDEHIFYVWGATGWISTFTATDLSNYYTKQEVNTELESKQDTLTGTQGQIVGFDSSGNAVAQAAPDTGVTTFNGRTGAVVPANGDYTAAQVGAVPTTRTINSKSLDANITLSASDVGAATMTDVNNAISTAITGAINASY